MKTDKEKMLAGEPYLAFCNELVEDRPGQKTFCLNTTICVRRTWKDVLKY